MMAAMPSIFRPCRVLIVDDEEPIVHIVDRVLRQDGYETAMALSGAEALALMDAGEVVDLLLTDLMMPSMTGDELARAARYGRPDLKVLYLTGFSDRLFELRPTLWENEAFVDKPVSNKGLKEAVSLILFGHTHGPATASGPVRPKTDKPGSDGLRRH